MGDKNRKMRVITFLTNIGCINEMSIMDYRYITYEETFDCIEKLDKNRAIRLETFSMANLSMNLFYEYNFDLIRILSNKYKPIYIYYNKNTKEIECKQTDKELHLSHNLFQLWLHGAFDEYNL